MTIASFLFLVVALTGFALRGFHIGGRYSMALGLFGLAASIFMLIGMSRVYTTGLQDRIIKLEMRVRCATLLSPAQQAALSRIEKPQLVALRFASDEELPTLLDRADREKLSANQIKEAIKNWVPDWDRT
jgi:hypothetical protein